LAEGLRQIPKNPKNKKNLTRLKKETEGRRTGARKGGHQLKTFGEEDYHKNAGVCRGMSCPNKKGAQGKDTKKVKT